MTEPDFEPFREELAKLNQRSEEMTAEMGALAGALVNVAQLQESQREIEKTARHASSRVEEIAARSATKDDIVELVQERRRAVRNFYAAVITGTLAVLTIGIGGVAAGSAYNRQQSDFRHAQYTNCTLRNQQLIASKQFTADLIDAEKASTDKATAAKLISALQQAQAKQVPVNCANLLGK